MGELTNWTRLSKKSTQSKYRPEAEGHLKEGSAPVILLGGVPGVGKTTVGNALLTELGLTHHISTGFLRAAIDHLIPEAQSELLRKHAFDAYEVLEGPHNGPESILKGCIAQSMSLSSTFKSCIRRARREGIGLVLEGSHFIPGIVDPEEEDADILCLLDVPNREDLKARAVSPHHQHRHFSDYDLERLVILQSQLVDMSHKHNIPVVVNTDLGDAIGQIRDLLSG